MEQNNLFNLGLICGRFQHIHKGHVNLINHALSMCNKTIILVGSAQEQGTLRNPFPIDTRIQLINMVFPNMEDKLIVRGMDDMTTEDDICYEWGEYVKKHVENYMGKLADVIISGDDKSREGWFAPETLKDVSRLIVARSKIQISATQVRKLLAIDDKQGWKDAVPEEIHHLYGALRTTLLNIPEYNQMYKESLQEKNN